MKSISEVTDTIEQYQEARILITAVEIRLFEVLGKEPLSLDALSQNLSIPQRSLKHLLDVLVFLDMVRYAENNGRERYIATDIAIQCFGPEGTIRNWALHQGMLYKLWTDLDKALKSGRPLLKHTHDIDVEAYAKGLADAYISSSPKVHEVVDFGGNLKILDAGGGSGIYSILAALGNPSLRAIVYDREEMVIQARKLIEQHSIGGQVSTLVGDLLKDDWPGEQDVVLISNVIHGKSPSEAQILLSKAFVALRPGGRIVLNEWVPDNLRSRCFDLNMLVCTLRGRVFAPEELTNLAVNAGFGNIITKRLNETHAILVGYKPWL